MDMKGVYVIVVTPFDDDDRIDEESLASEIEFCIAAGVHGLVVPANASEWYALSEEERRFAARYVSEKVAGRVPVIVAVTANSAHTAAEMTYKAMDDGATALMAMPPPIGTPNLDGIYKYYQAIGNASTVPVLLQNMVPPVGTPMTAAFMARMLDAIPNIDYVKEETQYSPRVITELHELIRDKGKFKGIFGGRASRFIMLEYPRDIIGTMPACDVPDISRKLWDLLESGDQAQARALFERMLPLINLESIYTTTLYKAVLHRRGVIRNPKVRNRQFDELDAIDQRELHSILDGMGDLFTVRGPFADG